MTFRILVQNGDEGALPICSGFWKEPTVAGKRLDHRPYWTMGKVRGELGDFRNLRFHDPPVRSSQDDPSSSAGR